MTRDQRPGTRDLRRGVTLIEILLALIVMVLGIVGILALFPAALQQSKESMEETQAGITGESVAQALTNALRFAQWNGTTTTYDVVMTHDLKYGPTGVKYPFALPKLVNEDWVHHPGGTGVAANANYDPEQMPAFNLGDPVGDPWVYSAVETVRNTNDMSDPYRQFGFSFSVMKINTLQYLIGTQKPDNSGAYQEGDLEGLVKLYEFRINIFRMLSTDTGTGTSTGSGGPTKHLIATITHRVSVK